MTNDRELRATPSLVEVRASAGDRRAIGGYAAMFNKFSGNLGGFVERIAPGFFNKSRADGWPGLDGQGVVARYNHNDNMILGRTSSRTLRLEIDGEGLRYEVDVPDSRADVYELVERGDIRQSSFAFIATQDEWERSDTNQPVRTLLEGKLVDVSPVVTPAYPDTTVALASLAKRFSAPPEEIRQLAADNELRRLFARSDGTPQGPMLGTTALTITRARKYPAE